MFTRWALWVIRSTRAAVRTGSPKISSQRSKPRLVVMIVDFRPVLRERWLKSSSEPSLSKDTYPNSSQITRSHFSNLASMTPRVFWECDSRSWVSNRWTVVNRTLWPFRQAFSPRPTAMWVFPVPGLPARTTFCPEAMKSRRSNRGSFSWASRGRWSRFRSSRSIFEGNPALRTRAFLRFCERESYSHSISPRRYSSKLRPSMAACLAISKNSRWNIGRRSSLLYCRIWSFTSFSMACLIEQCGDLVELGFGHLDRLGRGQRGIPPRLVPQKRLYLLSGDLPCPAAVEPVDHFGEPPIGDIVFPAVPQKLYERPWRVPEMGPEEFLELSRAGQGHTAGQGPGLAPEGLQVVVDLDRPLVPPIAAGMDGHTSGPLEHL